MTKTRPAQAANIETKLDLINQIMSTVMGVDTLLTTLGLKAP